MTDNSVKSKTALLTNVVLFTQLMDRLNRRTDKLPGIGVFYGFSGLGKSESAVYGANKHQAYYVEMGESWTRKKLLDEILKQLSRQMNGTIADKVDEVVRLLSRDNKPLIIDEADFAFNKGFHEIIREIHDKSHTPIILLGEERLPERISQFERFDNRVLEWVPAQPCNESDTQKLKEIYAPDVDIAPDLMTEIMEKNEGLARRMAVNFSMVQEISYNEGLEGFDLKSWKAAGHTLNTGKAPARRK